MATSDKKKYNKMENVLQYINKNFITVSDEDVKKANPILKHVIETIISVMKNTSPLFKNLFESVLYGGSFYDGLKVGKPEEFDIDLRLVLPVLLDAQLSLSNQPGFVTVQLKGWSTFEKSSEYERFKDLAKFKDDKNFLLVNKVLQWMESTVNLAFNTFSKVNNKFIIPYNGKQVEVALKKSGPALTALITYGDIYMDVDLVAVFKLSAEKWPPLPFKRLPKECDKKEFLIVPKTPKANVDMKERCWRMSFQEQEKVLFNGNNTCKPALRMIKKLRDTQNHNMISSYFIKTVFLHEIEKQDKSFWNVSLSYIFIHMLRTYKNYLETNKIPYYWNTNNNLLQYIDKTTIDNFKNFISRVIDAVDKKIDENPYIIADYLSTADEREELRKVQIEVLKKCTDNKFITELYVSESSNIDAIVANIDDCGINACNSPTKEIDTCSNKLNISKNFTTDNKNLNNDLFSMLKGIQSSINVLQSDVKLILNKISVLDDTVKNLKSDNIIIKDILQNSKSLQANNISELDKIAYSESALIDLQDNNDINKSVITNSESLQSNSETDNNEELGDDKNISKTIDSQNSLMYLTDSLLHNSDAHQEHCDVANALEIDENKISTVSDCDIKCLINKLNSLCETVQDIKTDNDALKTGLRQFVL